MDSHQISILKTAHSTGGIRGNTPQEQAILESLVSAGYLIREGVEAPFPGKAEPLPIYRLTVLGLARVKSESLTPI
jgi:hypothetical protein